MTLRAGRADVLVTGDGDLLALKASVGFAVESPAEYAKRFIEARSDRVMEPRRGYRAVTC